MAQSPPKGLIQSRRSRPSRPKVSRPIIRLDQTHKYRLSWAMIVAPRWQRRTQSRPKVEQTHTTIQTSFQSQLTQSRLNVDSKSAKLTIPSRPKSRQNSKSNQSRLKVGYTSIESGRPESAQSWRRSIQSRLKVSQKSTDSKSESAPSRFNVGQEPALSQSDMGPFLSACRVPIYETHRASTHTHTCQLRLPSKLHLAEQLPPQHLILNMLIRWHEE